MREVVRLTAELEDEFLQLHSAVNDAGWCRCIAWHVPTWKGWGERGAAENLGLRCELFGRGEHDGYLLREDDEPRAWCQVGPRDRLEKLVRQFELAPEPQAWAISCFLVPPPSRRRGLAGELLAGVLADLPQRGALRVEAFPRRGPSLQPGDLWTGPEAMFLRAGFKVVRDHPSRPVLALDLRA